MKNFYKNRKQEGYSMLEILFYVSLFAILSLVVIEAMITMTKSFKETSAGAEFIQSANLIERISREIRIAYDISSISATDLILNTKDDAGANKTIEFALSNGNIRLLENGTFVSNLNTGNVNVSSLTFTQINTTVGKAVRVQMSIQLRNYSPSRTENFYNTIVLRGKY